VRVARLKLKLKEAQLERDKALRTAHVSHTLVHRMEHSMQEETQVNGFAPALVYLHL